MLKHLISICSALALAGCSGSNSTPNSDLNSLANTLENRWTQTDKGINWQVNDTHSDHIEMSGEQVSAIIYYGNDEKGNLTLNRKIVWPMLRTIPNDTHASLIHDFSLQASPKIRINGRNLRKQTLSQVEFDGVLTLTTQLTKEIQLTRTISPSTTAPVVLERFELKNNSDISQLIDISSLNYKVTTDPNDSVYGEYEIEAINDTSGQFKLRAGDTKVFFTQFIATKKGQNKRYDLADELQQRQSYVASLKQNLQLDTPDPVINQMFDFAKLRANESIFRTKGGLMHGPGGSRYYAAIWANDQAEYVNPFFPFLGNDNGNESAIVSFETFAKYMNPDYRPIPSSIIAEGIDYWNGAGDRGDCAMIAYGASRFALAYGNKQQAKQLLPLIDWCIEFGERKKTSDGVIASDSDELEGRFPAGDVNLSTNTLAYGGYVSAASLHRELGNQDMADKYQALANNLRTAIETYFGANVQGYDTYRYFDGNSKLRAWIALPLTVGMFERKDATLDALLSEYLWSENGIYTEAGDKTFWDRATLYAFRGIFAAGATDTAMQYFKYYSRKRLLGDHVPYAVEAWPEGNQRHLSAESGLYARVVTEGLFGIEPTGLRQFTVAPRLPKEWPKMCLNHIRAFESDFNVCANWDNEQLRVKVTSGGKEITNTIWDQSQALEINL